ncbi:MAG: response regulator [Acetobacteraceae bacterium]|nr:response regulator [Acetobacteraceae bacterium]
MTPCKILLVEDEELIRLLLTEVLTDDGFEVYPVADGAAAQNFINTSQHFDLMFTDIQLPGDIDGLDVARMVRARTPAIPIIFTTGQPDRMEGWTVGPNDHFVAKPYRPFAICALIRRLAGCA